MQNAHQAGRLPGGQLLRFLLQQRVAAVRPPVGDARVQARRREPRHARQHADHLHHLVQPHALARLVQLHTHLPLSYMSAGWSAADILCFERSYVQQQEARMRRYSNKNLHWAGASHTPGSPRMHLNKALT